MTITKSLRKKLFAQAREAEFLGLKRIAANIDDSISDEDVRDEAIPYKYNHAELKADVEALLWKAAVRVQDFYNRSIDARVIQDMVEDHAQEFVSTLTTKAGTIAGAFEEPVAGQYERVEIEIEPEGQ